MANRGKEVGELLERISANDDQSAFREFFDIYFDRVFRSAFSVVKDIELSEEIVEDVFFNFWQMRNRYGEIRNVEAYLFISAKNLALYHIKKGKKILETNSYNFQPDQAVDERTAEQIVLTAELENFLDNAVERLPERCREIFKLVRVRGMKHREVAEALDISVKTVENQIAIALKKLHVELDKYLNEDLSESVVRKISS